MLSSVNLNCQVTKIVMNSGSQLSEWQSMSQRPQVLRIIIVIVKIIQHCLIFKTFNKLKKMSANWTAKNSVLGPSLKRKGRKAKSFSWGQFEYLIKQLHQMTPLKVGSWFTLLLKEQYRYRGFEGLTIGSLGSIENSWKVWTGTQLSMLCAGNVWKCRTELLSP